MAKKPVGVVFNDAHFMTADEKWRVLKAWERFLKGGCKREQFTKDLYHHLTGHCSFIAHYDVNGFYDTYFTNGGDTVRFLSQFDDRSGEPRSIEYGGTSWIRGDYRGDYEDINKGMVTVARKYVPQLIADAVTRQHDADLAYVGAMAKRLNMDLVPRR